MIFKSLVTRLLVLLLTFSLSSSLLAEPNLDEGKALFKANCAQCHNKNMKDKLTGPALGGVQERWEGREELLYAWIKNSQAVIASGDEYANAIYAEYNKSVMNAFPNLTDEQMESILGYIDGVYTGAIGGATTTAGAVAVVEKTDNTFLYITLFLILGILAVVLARIVSNLNHMTQVQEGEPVGQRQTLADILTSKGVIGFIIFALVVLGGFTTVNNAINLGRQQGYAPEQPIKFSHATHAGLHQIDCQYCHDGARRSKHSVIPATNTCMNCHKAIKKGSKYGTAEISKIYAAIGFDPNTDKYIENYDNMSEEDIEKTFKEWISKTYLDDNSLTVLDRKGERQVETEWKGIKTSLTNEQKTKIQGPIEWPRVHNLPDHVYFNHAQHVTVGQVECQQCHGPVEKMELIEQYAPLSMGWCVNCHRQTEVKFTSNDYYDTYEKYHEELKSGEREKVTVEEIGGLECQKCHY